MKKLMITLTCAVLAISAVFAVFLKKVNDSHQLLNAERVYVYGDSLALAGSGIDRPEEDNWLYYFDHMSGAKIVNRAASVTCIAKGNGYGITDEVNAQAFCERIETEDLSKTDYLMLAYGTSDYNFVIEMGEDNSEDKNTFKGALNYSLKKLSSEYPGLRIVLLTPLYSDAALVRNGRGCTLADYAEAISHIASLYNIPVIDLYHGMGINEHNWAVLSEDAKHAQREANEKIAAYVLKKFPGEIPLSQATVRDVMPAIGGYNLIQEQYFHAEEKPGLFSAAYMKNGVSFSLAPGKTEQSVAFLKIQPGETLYLTFWCNSTAEGQYFEADLYSDGILTTTAKYPAAGEQFMVCKFEIPENADPETLYQLRFTALPANTGVLNFGSLMLTRSNFPMLWEPDPDN